MIKVYFKRGQEKKIGKGFYSKDNFKNKLKAMFYIIEAKKYLKDNGHADIEILVNDEKLQSIANN